MVQATRNFFFGRHKCCVQLSQLFRYFSFATLVLFFTANIAAAQDSLVGGTLEGNEIWTNDFTYIVYKDLRIPEGITLTIQPGVTVKINQGRGIYVLGGNLVVVGQTEDLADTVNFVANHTNRSQLWKWKGISFTGSGDENINHFSFVKLVDAEIAIDIYDCNEVIIENSSLFDNQNIGVRIFNSKGCQIINCLFQNNYDGIEMVASDGNETSGSLVKSCVLKNFNHNIYLLNAFGGVFLNNTIENNVLEGGNNGIWADNGGGLTFGNNFIIKNVFINIGYEAGYGLLIAEDSLVVKNNIFWKNRIAIYYDPNTVGSLVKDNSFFQNEKSIILSAGSTNHEFELNTFTLNQVSVFRTFEVTDVHFNRSNIFNYPGKSNILINESRDNLDATQNFWNTSNDAEIQELIWDKQDNPELGIVNIIPFLEAADTVSPISPPQKPIKQLVNGEVKLSWSQNPESDVRGYTVYYGDFINYSFPYSVETEMDTVYYLSDVAISDSIAVTASDNVLNKNESQVMGHESPFSFASIYPYAGPDDVMCKIQTGFEISGSTIPYAYQSLEWSSNGDGFFSNAEILNPIYYPGTEDLLFGQVKLTLGVLNNGDTLFDSMILLMFEDPLAFAGNDTIIFSDSKLDLSTAVAENEQSVFWVSTGDGSFNNDTLLNPTYTPGVEDVINGEVDLVMIAQSECGLVTDTLKLFLEPYFSIEGNLWHNNQQISDGVILAIKEGEEGARATDVAQAGINGFFRFDRLMGGKYFIYAVPDTLLTNGAVPGYYANDLKWQDAYNFIIEANTYDVDIMLPSVDYQLPTGEGSISGYFEMPVSSVLNKDIYCNSWFEPDGKLDYCNGGLSNITVFLYNSNGTVLLDYTLTDAEGNFYFNNLPYGKYIIDAEKAGYQTVASSLITISPEYKHETGVVLILESKKIGIYSTSVFATNPLVDVYPNPTNGDLFIPINKKLVGTVISIYNSLGKIVLYKELSAYDITGRSSVVLDVSLLDKGIYVGKINSNINSENFIFIKN